MYVKYVIMGAKGRNYCGVMDTVERFGNFGIAQKHEIQLFVVVADFLMT